MAGKKKYRCNINPENNGASVKVVDFMRRAATVSLSASLKPA